VARLASNAASGPVVVSVSGNQSNAATVTLVTTGTIAGTITRATGGSAIAGATVQAVLTGVVKGTATTAANGTYSLFNLDPGTYDVRVLATGFSSEVRSGTGVSVNATTTLNVALSQPGSASVSFPVRFTVCGRLLPAMTIASARTRGRAVRE